MMTLHEVSTFAELLGWYRNTCAEPAIDTLLADGERILKRHSIDQAAALLGIKPGTAEYTQLTLLAVNLNKPSGR